MSVHTVDYKKLKKLVGIPNEEPVIIIRGQDDLAMAIVTRYVAMARAIEDPELMPSDEWFGQMDELLSEFAQYRIEYPERLKIPD